MSSTQRHSKDRHHLASACRVCGTALAGPGAALLRLAGISRSPRNPNVCTRCNTHFVSGQIRDVTVLFADLSGFTALTHEVGPERAHALVDAFLKRATEAVVAEDGYVDKYIGDAVMAVFNAPIARTDHATAAFRAAQAIQGGMPALSEAFGRPLRATAGLARGHARLGSLGGTGKGDHTLLGDVVNLAARLQSQAQPGEVVVDATVAEDLDTTTEAIPVEWISLKGFPEPVACHRFGSETTPLPTAILPRSKPKGMGVGALAFALLGAPCAATAALSPLALWLGIGSAVGAGSSTAVGGLDHPWIRLPLLTLSVVGALFNLAAAHRASRLRRELPSGGHLPPSNLDRRRTTWALGLSVLTILIVCAEFFFHARLHPHG